MGFCYGLCSTSHREREQLCDIDRETDKHGPDKHTNGEF
jgi:hypothetical protein